MKYLSFFILIFLFASTLLEAQDDTSSKAYIVIRVTETVLNEKTGQELAPKDRFLSSDPLKFSTSEATLTVIDEQKKTTFVLKPRPGLTAYTEKPSEERLGTRPGNILTYIALTRYLEGRRWLILDGKSEIEIGDKEFPMDANHFFYLQYNWTGDIFEPVNKKLSHRGTMLILSKKEILQVSEQLIAASEASNFKLFYYDGIKIQSLFINNFELIFADEISLKKEVEIIIEQIGRDDPNLLRTIDSYIFQTYGEPEISDLKNWLLRHFDLHF